mgnify:CR=1 FL=1
MTTEGIYIMRDQVSRREKIGPLSWWTIAGRLIGALREFGMNAYHYRLDW